MPTVRFAEPLSSNNISEGAGALSHQLVLSEASAVAVTVIVEGASYASADMQTAAQTITFQPGQTTATFTAAIYEDQLVEQNEIFSYTITSATNATIDKSGAIIPNNEFLGYILDNDVVTGLSVRFAEPLASNNVSEGAGSLSHQLVLSQASAVPVTVTVQGASYASADMQTAAQTITFQPGQTTAVFTAAIYDDQLVEQNEIFSYTITSATNAIIDKGGAFIANNEFLGYILDNDVLTGLTVRFAEPLASNNVSEGAGSLSHQLVLSQASSVPVTVTVEGASYASADMQTAAQTVTFQPGQTTATFTATVYDDQLVEQNEIFSYTITSATNATVDKSGAIIGNNEFLGYILDNDVQSGGPATPGQTYVATTAAVTYQGGAGGDTVTALSGSNYLRGNDGDDLIRGGSGFDDAHGNMGNDTVYGGDGDDWVVGGKDNDVLYGDGGFDIVYGNLGDDTQSGGDGVDWVRGGQGNDLLSGGAGDDFMSGDRGVDTLSGGAGADTFNFFAGAGVDRVLDFDGAAGDRIRFEGSAVSYSAVTVGAETQINFGNGDLLVLAGATNFRADWIVLTG